LVESVDRFTVSWNDWKAVEVEDIIEEVGEKKLSTSGSCSTIPAPVRVLSLDEETLLESRITVGRFSVDRG